MKQYMKKHMNEVKKFGSGFEQYFILHYNEKTGQFQFAEERVSAIETESKLAGYYCIISSEKRTAKEALIKYKSRDASEKLFRGDKSYLGNNSLRVYTDESASGKIFIEFVALIVRNRIYTYLQDEMKELEIRPNYMTVPAELNGRRIDELIGFRIIKILLQISLEEA